MPTCHPCPPRALTEPVVGQACACAWQRGHAAALAAALATNPFWRATCGRCCRCAYACADRQCLTVATAVAGHWAQQLDTAASFHAAFEVARAAASTAIQKQQPQLALHLLRVLQACSAAVVGSVRWPTGNESPDGCNLRSWQPETRTRWRRHEQPWCHCSSWWMGESQASRRGACWQPLLFNPRTRQSCTLRYNSGLDIARASVQ